MDTMRLLSVVAIVIGTDIVLDVVRVQSWYHSVAVGVMLLIVGFISSKR